MSDWLKNPPMGWNSYDYYDTTVNEAEIKANADYMAVHLKKFGWDYIVVDIEWYAKEAGKNRDLYQYVPFGEVEMDEYSRLQPDVNRFPSSKGGAGFGPLAEYVHSLGLKFGIHIMRGIPRQAAYRRTAIKNSSATANEVADPYSICLWNPDMYGLNPKAEGAQEYYDSLMELYARWGVDFIKCDDICRMDADSSREEILMLKKAIDKCGRQIVFSLSPGPAIVEEHDFYTENANMWRITDDFWDHWDSLRDMFDRCKNWQEYVTDGGYPDCDMLPMGRLGRGFGEERNTNFSFDEQKTMMSLWCIFRSPLMLGAELTKLDEQTLFLLTNERVFEMMRTVRDSREIYRDQNYIIWSGSSDEKVYIAIFNISPKDREVPFDLLRKADPDSWTKITEKKATDLWSGKTVVSGVDAVIPTHGVLLISTENE